MKRELQGIYETVTTAGEAVRAFIPAPSAHRYTRSIDIMNQGQDTAP